MVYTKYFAGVLNEQGVLQLSAEQWKRLMNIVYLEGNIAGLQRLSDQKQPYRFDIIIFKYQKKLSDLTGNLQPNELIREMYQLSFD